MRFLGRAQMKITKSPFRIQWGLLRLPCVQEVWLRKTRIESFRITKLKLEEHFAWNRPGTKWWLRCKSTCPVGRVGTLRFGIGPIPAHGTLQLMLCRFTFCRSRSISKTPRSKRGHAPLNENINWTNKPKLQPRERKKQSSVSSFKSTRQTYKTYRFPWVIL